MLPSYEKLAKGLAIYRQKHAKNYYIRVRIDKKEIRRNLGTDDVEEAKFRAWELRSDLENRKKQGLSILTTKKIMVNDIVFKVLNELENKRAKLGIYRDYQTVFKNYIIPFFEDVDLNDFTTKKVKLYFEDKNLSVTRKNINKTCFNMIFDYLLEEKIVKKNDIPELPKVKSQKIQTREPFSNSDLKVILEHLPDFYKIQSGNRKPNFKTVEYRKILYYYFIFLLETGVRCGEEVTNLQFNFIERENTNYFVCIKKGKTERYSNGRKIALSGIAVNSLLEIAKIQNPELNINIDNFLNIKKIILESSFGVVTEYSDIFKQFTDYLKSNNYIKNHYTLYSCRHYYITKRLSQGVDIYLISKYVGNSVEMIESHYDNYKLTNQNHINSLTAAFDGDIYNNDNSFIDDVTYESIDDLIKFGFERDIDKDLGKPFNFSEYEPMNFFEE